MLRRRERQESFFDSEIFSRMVPEGHPLELIKRHVDFSFVEEECPGALSPGPGSAFVPAGGTVPEVTAHAAAKTTVKLAREGRKKLLGVLSRHDARLAKELEAFGEPERDSDWPDHGRPLAAELDKGRELILRLKDRTEPDLVALRSQAPSPVIVANTKRMAKRLQAQSSPGPA